jgi:hypothetical protein
LKDFFNPESGASSSGAAPMITEPNAPVKRSIEESEPKSKAKAKLSPKAQPAPKAPAITNPEEEHEKKDQGVDLEVSSAQPRSSQPEDTQPRRARTRSPSRSHGVQIDNTTF